ncbi:MAG: endonuclease [Chloroflexi bacterium]|nr:endonuclease/exonuclease/phosphatase family protein [Chloroflexota bacterium]MQC26881.1 endonuclease [Chloroflexota bacterium]
MPFYYGLRTKVRDPLERKKVIEKLQSLRASLDANIPPKDVENTLLLATWNIREFDPVKTKYGKRLPESLYYIAEIISRFDLVAVQEVNQLGEWKDVMRILGSSWDYIATDVTDRSLGGNGERMVFVYDKRKVRFKNIAGEIVLPSRLLISKVPKEAGEQGEEAGKQFRRTPFVVSFQAGWFRFDLATVHIYYGSSSGEKLDERVEEIAAVANFLSRRADIGLRKDTALILLGDFNIVHPEHKTMKALLDNGFEVPDALRQKTNLDESKYYDQIAFKTKKDVIEFVNSQSDDPMKRNAGVFRLFFSTFRKNQIDDYEVAMKKVPALTSKKYKGDLEKFYKDWRTFQLSDHNPLWARLKVNESDTYLEMLKAGDEPPP